jgi:hypothetical protein
MPTLAGLPGRAERQRRHRNRVVGQLARVHERSVPVEMYDMKRPPGLLRRPQHVGELGERPRSEHLQIKPCQLVRAAVSTRHLGAFFRGSHATPRQGPDPTDRDDGWSAHRR